MRQSTPHLTSGIISGVIAALIWGSWPILSQLAVKGSLNAYDLTALRFGVAGLVLLPYLWKKGIAGIPKRCIAMMVFGAGAPYVLFGIATLKFAPAGHFGIVTPSAMLTVSSLGAWLILGEPMTRLRVVGLIMIITGIAMVGWEGMAHAGVDPGPGHLLFVICGAMWAVYNLASRYFHVGPLHGTAIVSVFSMVLYLPFYAIWGMDHLLAAPYTEIIFHGLFQGVITAVVALLMFTRATALLGAGQGATFSALAPAFAVLLAWPILGDRPTVIEICGLVVVTSGMLTAVLSRKAAAPASELEAGSGQG